MTLLCCCCRTTSRQRQGFGDRPPRRRPQQQEEDKPTLLQELRQLRTSGEAAACLAERWRRLAARTDNFLGRKLYQYFNWRQDTSKDLVVTFGVFSTLVLAAGMLRRWAVDNPGDRAGGNLWADIYQVQAPAGFSTVCQHGAPPLAVTVSVHAACRQSHACLHRTLSGTSSLIPHAAACSDDAPACHGCDTCNPLNVCVPRQPAGVPVGVWPGVPRP